MASTLEQQPYSLSNAEGFESFRGTPIATIGEDCSTLLMLGHPDQRTILAATCALYRDRYGQRILPDSGLAEMINDGIRQSWARAVPADDCPWHTEETSADAAYAQPITLVDAEWLDAEDVAVLEECPACGRASRSTDFRWSPGRTGWSRVHRCRHCTTQWPSADAYRVGLYKMPPTRSDDRAACFACGRTEGTTATAQPIDQPLCQNCHDQHTPDTWQALTAAGYATPASDAQRDRWLYTEALRGTPPATAATAWTERRALARHRALAAHKTAEPEQVDP
ncbi:hypothetical protein [Streptomyces antimycoticus]